MGHMIRSKPTLAKSHLRQARSVDRRPGGPRLWTPATVNSYFSPRGFLGLAIGPM